MKTGPRNIYRRRRFVVIFIVLALLSYVIIGLYVQQRLGAETETLNKDYSSYKEKLERLKIAEHYSEKSYQRSYFGDGWTEINGCNMRNLVLYRDLVDVKLTDGCNLSEGLLLDPYSGKYINFVRGITSKDIEIDHVVALSNAWVTGAENMSGEERIIFANDPLELLAVSAKTNQEKSDSDAAEWLPPYKPYRCEYVSRQIDVKLKYKLWVTKLEYNAMLGTLNNC